MLLDCLWFYYENITYFCITINYENIKKNLIIFVISMLYMHSEVTLKIKQKFSEFFGSKKQGDINGILSTAGKYCYIQEA